MNVTFSILGLGKLGASMAAAIASRGFNVIGVDINQSAVDAINAGHAPVQETRLEETLAENVNRIRATLDHREAILNSDVTFVVVPTPSDGRGAFSLEYAAASCREIGRALAQKNDYHNVVLCSTVLPGSTRYGLLPILESASDKKCGRDFGLCYSPEFIALGSVIEDFLNPDFVLIGEFDERAGSQLESCYAEIVENSPLCRRMSLENAELTKIALNAYVTTKITFANMLADISERIPGGDVNVVSDALGLDSRIGRKYLTGALGYGGPCFPRDNLALSFIAEALDSPGELPETTDRINRSLTERFLKRLRDEKLVEKGMTVAVLGLAYKPLTHVIEESQGIYLAKAFAEAGARVVAYDPLAGETSRTELKGQAVVLDSMNDCLTEAELVVITTPDPAFKRIRAEDFRVRDSVVTVVDFWRILDRQLAGQANVRYVPFGCSRDDQGNAKRLAQLWRSAFSGFM